MRRATPFVALVALAGCGGGSGHAARQPARQPARGSSDASLIRGWSRALNAGQYARAASYFARGALVEQTDKFRLPGRRAAEEFNRGLPCRADITEIQDEGSTTLASFRLKRGPGGPCQGDARVRFKIAAGKFTEWRQLPDASQPPPGVQA